MAFFDELGKKISSVAGTAADKAKDLGEIAKLKAEIMKKQASINSETLELGRAVYEAAKKDASSTYAAQCASISGYHAEIENLRARIALVKDDGDTDAVVTVEAAAPVEKVCPACGEKLPADAKFCSKCGATL